jgi:hypothetical protein
MAKKYIDANDIEYTRVSVYWGKEDDKDVYRDCFVAFQSDIDEMPSENVVRRVFSDIYALIDAGECVDEALKAAIQALEEKYTNSIEDEDINLPVNLTIMASELQLDADDIVDDDDELSEVISDYLSDTYGFCHNGFNFEVIKNEFGEPSEFVITNIDWDTTD